GLPGRPRRWPAPATRPVWGLPFMPLLPRTAPAEPAERLTRIVVAEHTRAVMWGARRPDILPASLPWLTQESGITLSRVFVGDDQLTLIAAEPVYLDQRRGLALHHPATHRHPATHMGLPPPP